MAHRLKMSQICGFEPLLGWLAIGILTTSSVSAQTASASAPGPRRPTFEVATIKTELSEGPATVQISHGRLTIRNYRLSGFIQLAYGVQFQRIVAADWVKTIRYSISAKASSDETTQDELMQMLQTLLAERFRLSLHHETREVSAFILTIGKNGPRMRPSLGEGVMILESSPGRTVFKMTSMANLAGVLSSTGTPVIDLTGLAGRFDFTLDYGPYIDQIDARNEMAARNAARLVAVERQLGLKVDMKKAPIEMLVVDHAERVPTDN